MLYRSDINIDFIIFSEDQFIKFALRKLLSEVKNVPVYQNVNFVLTEATKPGGVFSVLKKQNASLIIFDFDSLFFSEKIKILEQMARPHRKVRSVAICNRRDYNHHAYFYNAFCDIVLKKDDAIEIYSGVIYHEINILLTKKKGGYHYLSLSTRERDILKWIMKGRSNSEIAALMFISVKTVSTHRTNIYSKFNARTISDLYKATCS